MRVTVDSDGSDQKRNSNSPLRKQSPHTYQDTSQVREIIQQPQTQSPTDQLDTQQIRQQSQQQQQELQQQQQIQELYQQQQLQPQQQQEEQLQIQQQQIHQQQIPDPALRDNRKHKIQQQQQSVESPDYSCKNTLPEQNQIENVSNPQKPQYFGSYSNHKVQSQQGPKHQQLDQIRNQNVRQQQSVGEQNRAKQDQQQQQQQQQQYQDEVKYDLDQIILSNEKRQEYQQEQASLIQQQDIIAQQQAQIKELQQQLQKQQKQNKKSELLSRQEQENLRNQLGQLQEQQIVLKKFQLKQQQQQRREESKQREMQQKKDQDITRAQNQGGVSNFMQMSDSEKSIRSKAPSLGETGKSLNESQHSKSKASLWFSRLSFSDDKKGNTNAEEISGKTRRNKKEKNVQQAIP